MSVVRIAKEIPFLAVGAGIAFFFSYGLFSFLSDMGLL